MFKTPIDILNIFLSSLVPLRTHFSPQSTIGLLQLTKFCSERYCRRMNISILYLKHKNILHRTSETVITALEGEEQKSRTDSESAESLTIPRSFHSCNKDI